MATLANMYAATHCKVPIFKWEDRRWHVTYVENEKWQDRKFQDPELAYGFYLYVFHKLEKEYITNSNKDRGSR